MKKVIKYQPDCCERLFKTPEQVKRHEAVCNRNPANKTCFTCLYSETEFDSVEGYDIFRFCGSDERKKEFGEYPKFDDGSSLPFARRCPYWILDDRDLWEDEESFEESD